MTQHLKPERAGLDELVIISGKGGTGKTSIAASLAVLARGTAVLADCDVDAANLGLILRPTVREEHEFMASKLAFIDQDKCEGCGTCLEVCRSHAIEDSGGRPAVNEYACEGCGVCFHVCPAGAVEMRDVVSGRWFVSETPYGPLVHARLGPGEENSGKLVTLVRRKAAEMAEAQGKDLIIIDGPPGIGCPVIACLSGASRALIVTEPTLAGLHDMERVLEVCHHFEVPAQVVINRFDIDEANTRRIRERCSARGIEVVALIPFDTEVTRAAVRGMTIVEASDGRTARCIRALWEKLNSERPEATPKGR
ncbi:MAG TPA: (4Fe-4S)-binding protein [Clostridiales bacterium]|nr:(4Fe-4S)-binding protein [Clostridiales bacterium]